MLNLPNLKINGQNVLLAAIGGGFDIFGSLPILFSLNDKNVFLSSYNLNNFDKPIFNYTKNTIVPYNYFPENLLVENTDILNLSIIGKVGVTSLVAYYKKLIEMYSIDHIITIDCGVDSLMIGDEEYKGTITEEYVNFAALKQIDIPRSHICLGFGTEKEENISHYRVLENISSFMQNDCFLGSCSMVKNSLSFKLYKSFYENGIEKFKTHKRSHIHPRMISAIEGKFGEFLSNENTLMSSSNHQVFLSCLMSMYWFFDGNKLTDMIPILNDLKDDRTFKESYIKISNLPKTRKNLPIPY